MSTDQISFRIEEARKVLTDLGMDNERSNERSALVLLALLNLGPHAPWTQAQSPMLGTRAIMDFIRDEYHKEYAPNSRETIRRFTLHQFVESYLVIENADHPGRPVNSPKWNYRVTEIALETLQRVGKNDWASAVENYRQNQPSLLSIHAAERDFHRVPITLPNGEILSLTPGGQNILIKQIMEDFCSQFTPGGEILYIGDAGNKWSHVDIKTLGDLGISFDTHGKMPDLIVYLRDRNWLVLIEAASTHGPVDSTRQNELRSLFSGSSAGLVFVSCFPTRTDFRRYVDQIAWESEVWCADHPTHMIHYNGERFLGPYSN